GWAEVFSGSWSGTEACLSVAESPGSSGAGLLGTSGVGSLGFSGTGELGTSGIGALGTFGTSGSPSDGMVVVAVDSSAAGGSSGWDFGSGSGVGSTTGAASASEGTAG